MTKPRGTDPAGQPVDLIGEPLHPGRGSVPGLTVVKREDAIMAKADTNGVYTLNGHRFRIRKGDTLPDGAVMAGDEPKPEAAPVEERARKAAPENKAKQSAPEQK